MKTIGYVTAADPFHDRKAWSGTIYKVREAIENAGFNVFWIPVRLSFLHNLYVKISAFRYGRLVSRNDEASKLVETCHLLCRCNV